MAKIEHIKNKRGEVIYPVSKEGAIYDENGVLLSTKIATFITRLVDNLANYYLKSETYTKGEVDNLIGAIQGFTYIVVSELPTASAETMGIVYLVPSEDPQTQNVKDEYITIRSGVEGSYTYSWEQIGSTAIDLSGYVTTEALNTELAKYTTTANLTTLLAGKQDTISDLSTIRSGAAAGATAYQKPGTGIPATDMASGVQTSLGKADSAYQKPSGGIPKTDLESGVQESLELADSAVQADPIGSIVPPVDPSEFATKEEVEGLEAKVDDIDEEIEVSATELLPSVTLNDMWFTSSGVRTESGKVLVYWPVENGKTYNIDCNDTTTTFRIGYTSTVPAPGVSVTNLKSGTTAYFSPTTAPYTGYLMIAHTSFQTGYPKILVPKSSGIGLDVYNLKRDVNDLQPALDVAVHEVGFSKGYRISNGNDSRYPAGGLIPDVNGDYSDFVDARLAKKLIYNLFNAVSGGGAGNCFGVCFYDAEKNYISGLQADGNAEILKSEFPANTAYIRFSSNGTEGAYARIITDKDFFELTNDVLDLQGEEVPSFRYWAVCGDSITHANHSAISDLAPEDPYYPIDDYVGKLTGANSGAHPNYAYYFCKKHEIKWANYGFGGTILGDYVPKYMGAGGYIRYPFVNERLSLFKEGVDWDFITIFFGWNDNQFGPIYQKDKWLTETYGEDLGYPVNEEQIGTAGFADATQKAACDAIDEEVFFDAFIGTINDAGKDTWYGAWNYALNYLMREYPNAKIMPIVPFIGGADRTHSQKFRASVIAIAEKFGLTYFDINDLPYWYHTTVRNTTSFPNPDQQDGRWGSAPATVEGFNRHRYSADGTHPTPLGYQVLAEPLGYTLLDK